MPPDVCFGSFATEPFNLWADRCPLLSESDKMIDEAIVR